MQRWAKLALWLGVPFVAVAAALSLRALVMGSRQVDVAAVPPLAVDARAAAERLAGAVRFETISFDDRPDASADAIFALHDYVARRFPRVHRALKLEKIGRFSLLYTWTGSDPALKPVILMAHQDMVPIAPGSDAGWQHPPFSGDIADGFVWGRGSWDDKSNLLAVLEALEALVAAGATPRRTVLLASGHDEEVGGARGARQIAALLQARGTQLEFVIDEGQVILDGGTRGISRPVALIGLAEKGSLTLSLTAHAAPGHSSMPPRASAIGALSTVLDRLENDQMPARLAGVTRESLEAMAPEMGFVNRLALANLWLTAPIVQARLEGQPATNAMLRTTTALTVVNGGSKSNVLPARANALVNFRILPGDSMDSVEGHARKAVGDLPMELTRVGEGRDPSPVSPSTSDGYRLIERTIREIFPGTVVAPGLVIAGTDSRYMSALSPNVYRFLPIRVGSGDMERFHGTNERVSIDNYVEAIRFFHRLITVSCID
jgi:carboxypeptidase PM20D1